MREKGAHTGLYTWRVHEASTGGCMAIHWLFTGRVHMQLRLCADNFDDSHKGEAMARRRAIATRASDGHEGEISVRFESMKCM